jgi:O-antigen/teichoic acid export membrane protein
MMRTDSTRRIGWGALDQGLSSATNFIVAVATARGVSAQAFGAFAAGWLAYVLVVGWARAALSEPFLVRSATTADEEDNSRGLLGSSVLSGGLFGLGLVVLGMNVSGEGAGPLVVVGVFLPLLLCHDAVRHILISAGRAKGAAVNDGAWGVAVLVAVLVLGATGRTNAWSALLAWAVIGSVAALIGVAQARRVPSLTAGTAFLRREWYFVWRYSIEFISLRSSGYLVIALAAVIGGLSEVGALRGALTLAGPLIVIQQAVPLVLLPEAGRLLGLGYEALRKASRRVSILSSGIAVIWLGLLALLPTSAGQVLLGDSWAPAAALLPAFLVQYAFIGWTVGCLLALRTLGEAARTLVIRAIVAPVTIAAGVGGTVLWGAPGAAIGLAVGSAVAFILFELGLRRMTPRGVV